MSPTNNSSTDLRMQNRRAVTIFGAGIQTAMWQYGYPTPRKWRGNPRGETSPLGTRLSEKV